MLNKNRKYDVIIVGSGPAGAHVALPLVRAGLNVVMIDGGITSKEPRFNGSFEEIRKDNWKQNKLFFGSEFKGLVSSDKGSTHSQSMTNGARSYISERTMENLPISGAPVSIVQTLAKGGLSETWGAACDIPSKEEMSQMGLPAEQMHRFYQEVIDLIGVSGDHDKLNLQPPAELDLNGRQVIRRYNNTFKGKKYNFYVKRAMLAVITKNLGKRKPLAYRDMEYWLNEEKSIYRARFTIQEMQREKNFKYLPGKLVSEIITSSKYPEVKYRELGKNTFEKIKANKVVLAAGSINSIRILIKSFKTSKKIPMLVKPHVLIPCLNLGTLGKAGSVKKHSLCQLFVKDMKNIEGLSRSFTQLYSYKSLLYFKLLPFSPFSAPESLSLLSIFSPSLVIADARFPSFESEDISVSMSSSNYETGELKFNVSENAWKNSYDYGALKDIKKFLIKMNLIPIKTVFTPLGSTAHYAGGAPFSKKHTSPFSTKEDGSLWVDNRIIIADASTWNVLPANPPALTIMANARRIGFEIARNWNNS